MQVRILQLIEGARRATGAAVVIDVFRAFSFAAFAFRQGCVSIRPVGDPAEAVRIREAAPGVLLAGERFTRRLPGFDFGNSPTEIESVDLSGRTLVHTTHAGTQGLVNARSADPVLAGSFVNARATAAWLRDRGCPEVSLVCMGHQAERPCDEDTLCAEYLRDLLTGRPPRPIGEIRERLRRSESAEKFFDPSRPWTPERDFDLCLSLDAVDFAMVRRALPGGGWMLERT